MESIQGHRSCRWHLRDSADGLGLELKLSKSTVGASHALSEPSFARVCLSEFMGKALAQLPREVASDPSLAVRASPNCLNSLDLGVPACKTGEALYLPLHPATPSPQEPEPQYKQPSPLICPGKLPTRPQPRGLYGLHVSPPQSPFIACGATRLCCAACGYAAETKWLAHPSHCHCRRLSASLC